MPAVHRVAAIALVTGLAVFTASCLPRALTRQYEYEQELYLDTDGSATLVLNASIAALQTLNAVPDAVLSGQARVERNVLRRHFESAGLEVTRVSRPWRRNGRPYVQVRIEVPDISRLSAAPPFAASTFAYKRTDGTATYQQTVSRATSRPPDDATWNGSELVAFRLHLPSRILHHNAPSKRVERGNILVWEQSLRERLAGAPVEMVVRMEPESILHRTIVIFAGAAAAALALLAAAIWWVVRRGRAQVVTAAAPPPRGGSSGAGPRDRAAP
jgi:hypothetical protein